MNHQDHQGHQEVSEGLVRRDQDRWRLRGFLLDGASSQATIAADRAYFNDLRKRVRRPKEG